MKCTNCNASIPDDSTFCEHCGAKVEPMAAQQPTPEGMTRCPNCSAPLPAGSKFCEHCGAQLQSDGAGQTPPPVNAANMGGQTPPPPNTPYMGGQMPPQEPKPKKPIDKRLIAVAAAAVCVILVVVIAVVTHKKTIDLNDYVEVVFSGYDGYGTASVDFDWDSFEADMEASMKVKGSSTSGTSNYDWSDLADDLSDYYGYYQVYDVDYSLDETESLSNGDEVTISFTFDNDAAKEYGIKFKGDDETYTVEGLESVREVDPFADIEVTFSGVAPDVYVSVTNNSTDEALSDIYYYADPSSGISKGDTITVYADVDEDYFLSTYGCMLTATSQEYTCESVDAYITDGSDIGEDLLEDMKSQTQDTIEEYFANEADYISVSELTYVGYYFLSAKNSNTYGDKNVVYVVYSGTVQSLEEEGFASTTVYFPVEFTNVLKYADGTDYVDLYDTSIEGETDLEYGWWDEVEGYESQSKMKNELVTSQKSSYSDQTFGDLE